LSHGIRIPKDDQANIEVFKLAPVHTPMPANINKASACNTLKEERLLRERKRSNHSLVRADRGMWGGGGGVGARPNYRKNKGFLFISCSICECARIFPLNNIHAIAVSIATSNIISATTNNL
jgi:hypothetical protein